MQGLGPGGSWTLRLELRGDVWLQTKVWVLAAGWERGAGDPIRVPPGMAETKIQVRVFYWAGIPGEGWGRELGTGTLLSGLPLWTAGAQCCGTSGHTPQNCPKGVGKAGIYPSTLTPLAGCCNSLALGSKVQGLKSSGRESCWVCRELSCQAQGTPGVDQPCPTGAMGMYGKLQRGSWVEGAGSPRRSTSSRGKRSSQGVRGRGSSGPGGERGGSSVRDSGPSYQGLRNSQKCKDWRDSVG